MRRPPSRAPKYSPPLRAILTTAKCRGKLSQGYRVVAKHENKIAGELAVFFFGKVSVLWLLVVSLNDVKPPSTAYIVQATEQLRRKMMSTESIK